MTEIEIKDKIKLYEEIRETWLKKITYREVDFKVTNDMIELVNKNIADLKKQLCKN